MYKSFLKINKYLVIILTFIILNYLTYASSIYTSATELDDSQSLINPLKRKLDDTEFNFREDDLFSSQGTIEGSETGSPIRQDNFDEIKENLNICDLPNEILEMVFENLDTKDHANLSLVNKHFSDLVDSLIIWSYMHNANMDDNLEILSKFFERLTNLKAKNLTLTFSESSDSLTEKILLINAFINSQESLRYNLTLNNVYDCNEDFLKIVFSMPKSPHVLKMDTPREFHTLSVDRSYFILNLLKKSNYKDLVNIDLSNNLMNYEHYLSDNLFKSLFVDKQNYSDTVDAIRRLFPNIRQLLLPGIINSNEDYKEDYKEQFQNDTGIEYETFYKENIEGKALNYLNPYDVDLYIIVQGYLKTLNIF